MLTRCLKRAQVIPPNPALPEDDNNILGFNTDEADQEWGHRRAASSSSRGSMPPDTDFDMEPDDEQELADDEEEEETKAVRPFSLSISSPFTSQYVQIRKHELSAQQIKYNQEVCFTSVFISTSCRPHWIFKRPEIRASKVLHTATKTITESPESDWHPSARLVFPAAGGGMKLLQQNQILKQILKSSIELHVYEIGFKQGYEAVVSRSAIVRRLVRLTAKKHDQGEYIEKRAKQDTPFCARLAPIVCNTLPFNILLTFSNRFAPVVVMSGVRFVTAPSRRSLRTMGSINPILHRLRFAPSLSSSLPTNAIYFRMQLLVHLHLVTPSMSRRL
jgi:hypothetical protein